MSKSKKEEVSALSLRETEKALYHLWTNRDIRQRFMDGSASNSPASELNDITPSIWKQIDKKGVELYGELLQLGRHDVMLSIYPYCAKILGPKWTEVVEAYLITMPPSHFNFNRLCQKFPEYLSEHGKKFSKHDKLLSQIADYEWQELEVMEDAAQIIVRPRAELSNPAQIAGQRPQLNPTLRLREYDFAIPDITNELDETDTLPKSLKKETTYVVIYRDPISMRARLIEISEFSAHIIKLAEQSLSYLNIIQQSVQHCEAEDPQQAVLELLQEIEELYELNILTGSEAL